MICGGEGEIFVDYLDAANSDIRQVYEAVLSTVESAQKAWLITELTFEPGTAQLRQQCLVTREGTIIGSFQCDPEFLDKLSSGAGQNFYSRRC